MSLNKFTDSVDRKQWMNINCNDLKCATLEADNIIFPPITELEKLTIRGDDLPQLSVQPLSPSSVSNVQLAGGSQQLLTMLNASSFFCGEIVSKDIDNSFTIDPQTRQDVRIEGPLQLRKQVVINNPDEIYLSLYSKDGNDNLYKKDSLGNELQIATLSDIPSFVDGTYGGNLTLNAGGTGFNQPNPTAYSVEGRHVSLWGVFRLDPNATLVDVQIDEVPGYPVDANTLQGALNGNKFGPGAVSYIGVDTAYSGGIIQMLYGTANNVSITPANNTNTLFQYRVDYLTPP